MSENQRNSPEPGWYQSADDPSVERWFDGVKTTDLQRPVSIARTPARRRAWLIPAVIGIAVVLVGGIVFTAVTMSAAHNAPHAGSSVAATASSESSSAQPSDSSSSHPSDTSAVSTQASPSDASVDDNGPLPLSLSIDGPPCAIAGDCQLSYRISNTSQSRYDVANLQVGAVDSNGHTYYPYIVRDAGTSTGYSNSSCDVALNPNQYETCAPDFHFPAGITIVKVFLSLDANINSADGVGDVNISLP